MSKVACIMPIRGRVAQVIELLPRLQSTAGYEDVAWMVVADGDEAAAQAVMQARPEVKVGLLGQRRGYWRCLAAATERIEAPLLVNLASDLLPGHQWLRRALEVYVSRGPGGHLVGFSDGIHAEGHAPHFVIGRDLLMRYGGWPVWYDHLYGDTELCLRAQADGRYAKAPWAVLYHNHPITGAARDDVYALGEAQGGRDRELFETRKAAGWPPATL